MDDGTRAPCFCQLKPRLAPVVWWPSKWPYVPRLHSGWAEGGAGQNQLGMAELGGT